jgi:hypothetical protein
MKQGRRLRTGILTSIGAAVVLVLGQGVGLAAEGSATLDDPVGNVTDIVDEPLDTISDAVDTVNDAVDDPVDTVKDAVDDPVGTVDDAVDDPVGAVDDAVDDPVDDPVGAVDDAVNDAVGSGVGGVGDVSNGPGDDLVDGTGDGGTDALPGSETGSLSSPSTPLREDHGSRGARLSSRSSDLDELAQGGNDVVEGPGGTVCVGSASAVCLDLVGGLGPIGILFRAAEGARRAVSAFVDTLASTGLDLLGASVALITLTLVGIALVSRRSGARQPRGKRSLAGT